MLHAVTSPTHPVPQRLEVAVLDWAGTTVDYGSRAPIIAIRHAFEQLGVPVSEQEARRPMGRAKRDHLSQMLAEPDLAARWRTAFGTAPDEAAIDRVYDGFLASQSACVAENSAVIPGCVEAIEACRQHGLRIGSTTGYTRELLEQVVERARSEGYEPEVMLGADDVTPGRPAPWLCCEAARRLSARQMAAVVKVDDTPAGVRAGRHAGAWAVGVVESGNEVGLSIDEFARLTDEERRTRCEQAAQTLQEAGAHLLIDTIADLPAAVDRINTLIADGERP
ncbi:MAG: phosphonoacetaldehyde hydrolase [Planctomycetota bacterium]